MAIEGISIGQELLNVPMGEMVRSMAMAIADAQWALDRSSMTVAELMSGQRLLRDLNTGKLVDGNGRETTTPTVIDSRIYFGYNYNIEDGTPRATPLKVSMLELGFTPNFYQFVDTIIEVKISVSFSRQTESVTKSNSAGAAVSSWWGSGYSVSTSQVNGQYATKFGYSVEGSSLLRTKLVSIPPPAILEERIRNVAQLERAYEQWKLLSDLKAKAEQALLSATPDEKAGREESVKRIEREIEDLLVAFGTAKS